ncbi:MAG: GrpB family protein [Caulobacter sp.]|nr:GrpB family protein [Caulobacter sp.]
MAPSRRRVELVAPDPAWTGMADRHGAVLGSLLGDNLISLHHIGSTAIPGILAKPVIDLLPVVHELARVDGARPALVAAGFQWRGENGIAGRRFCLLEDPASGLRLVHVHIFVAGSAEIDRHLAFRDYLRAHPGEAADYQAQKQTAARLHPEDPLAYNDAKSDWIKACEQRALAWRRGG